MTSHFTTPFSPLRSVFADTVKFVARSLANSVGGNKCRFRQIFVEAIEEFPILFIQSETSPVPELSLYPALGFQSPMGGGKREFRDWTNQKLARALTSSPNRASKYVALLSNLGDEHRGLSPVSEAGFRYQLVLVPPTEIKLI